MKLGDQSEEIVIQSESGTIEVSITFTEGGPVARIVGAQLLIESPGKVGISCNDLEIRATNRLQMESGGEIGLRTGGELRMRSAEQTFIDGDFVNLNCLSRAGYHDEHDSEGDGSADSTTTGPSVGAGDRRALGHGQDEQGAK
jgi:hypothetical protein